MLRTTVATTLALLFTFGLAATADARPLDVSITFTVSGGPGNYLYDFTVHNDSEDPIDIYSLAIDESDLTPNGTPGGWGQVVFSPVQWCTNGDCFDTTGGIAPGSELSGFTATSASPDALTEARWTVAIVGPTVASFELPVTAGDTAQYAGIGFALGATGKRQLEIISPSPSLFTQAFGINDAGQVVGGASGVDVSFAYLYDIDDGSLTMIDTTITPLEINNAGVIVGNANDMCVIRDELGVETVIQPPTPFTFCDARGVNSSGQVSGFTFDDLGFWRGFVYDPQSGTFEEFLPSLQTFAVGLRDNGDLVGSLFVEADGAFPGSPSGRYGYLRSADGSLKLFEIAQALDADSRARGLSESGLVSGWYRDAATAEIHAYVTTLSPGTDFEEVTLTEGEIIYRKPCNPNTPPPPSPDYTLRTSVFAGQVRDDGVVVGSCEDAYFNDTSGDSVFYGYGFVSTPVVFDADGDGVLDVADNCVDVANVDQVDADSDGFGNICDADLNQDCVTNAVDLGLFRAQFFTNSPVADLNSDGIVNPVDLGIFRSLFFAPPGPSGIADCGT